MSESSKRADGSNEAIGSGAAAMLSAAIGCAVLGAITCLAEASAAVRHILNFHTPVGPLGGKVAIAVVVWLAVWVVLHVRLNGRRIDLDRVIIVTWSLVAAGVLFTLPPVFYLFD